VQLSASQEWLYSLEFAATFTIAEATSGTQRDMRHVYTSLGRENPTHQKNPIIQMKSLRVTGRYIAVEATTAPIRTRRMALHCVTLT